MTPLNPPEQQPEKSLLPLRRRARLHELAPSAFEATRDCRRRVFSIRS